MVCLARKIKAAFAATFIFGCLACLLAQDSPFALVTSGQITMDGRRVDYLIRHLPVSSFPQLPSAIQADLTRRQCLVPQTYEAHQPENVIHGSFERPSSSDWAALCSTNGTVSLLVFFGDGNGGPAILATARETERLQLYGADKTLGFDWGIDPASPDVIHQAQLGMHHPPPRLDHDALADSIIEFKTVYRFYSHNAWTTLNTQD